MIIGESEKNLGNFMGSFFFLGVAFWIFIRLFYTWVSLICLYSSYGYLATPSPAAGKALCIMLFFLLGFILSFNFLCFLQALHADCTAQFGGFFLRGILNSAAVACGSELLGSLRVV